MKPARILDSHIHLVDTDGLGYVWREDGAAPMRVFPQDFAAVTKGYPVEQFMFIEAGVKDDQSLKEAAWVADLATRTSSIAGIVAQACLERGAAVEEELHNLSAIPLVRGVRRILEPPFQTDLDFCIRPGFIEGTRLLARYGLTCDISVKNNGLPNVIRLVEACPDVEFILDHIGKPFMAAGEWEPWRSDIRRLASHGNVACKISGVPVEAGPGWTVDQVRPYIAECFDSFGFDRVMFGSDYPAQNSVSTFGDWADAMIAILSEVSDDEVDCYFYRNARRFYGIA